MRLVNASRYFDDVVIHDAYTNAPLFKGQVAAYIDSQVDGTISRRRTISLASNLVLPARRTLKYGNEIWLVGDGVKDHLQGVALRTSYAAKRCDEAFLIQTPGKACTDATGTIAYGQSDYLKSTVNSPTDSNYDAQYEIHFSSYETLSRGQILSSGGRYYSVRGTHKLLEGFVVAETDAIDAVPATVTFTDTGTYDPVTDTYPGTAAPVLGLYIDMYKQYVYKTTSDPLNRAGDTTLLVAASAITPKVGQVVDSIWRVEQALPHLDAWLCHLRRV